MVYEDLSIDFGKTNFLQNEGASKENLHFDDQGEEVVSLGFVMVHDRTEKSCTVSTSRCPIQSLRKVF